MFMFRKGTMICLVAIGLCAIGCLFPGYGVVNASTIPLVNGETYKWVADGVTFTFHSNRGQEAIEVSINGVAFFPFVGLGPKFEIDGRIYEPREANEIVVVRSELDNNVLSVDYELNFRNNRVSYNAKIWVEGNTLYVRFSTDDPRARGVTSGISTGLSKWRKFDITRLSELYAQRNLPQPMYSYDGDFFFYADWDYMQGNGTTYYYVYGAPPQDGSGIVKIAPDVRYDANTAGKYLPVVETLRFSVDPSLWNAVPDLPQQPSKFRSELKNMVFLDLWGGVNAAHYHALLKDLSLLTRGLSEFYTIVQGWAYGNWDQYIPDNFRIPDIVPDPQSVKELREFVAYAKGLGYVGLRCNYLRIVDASPSYKSGVISRALEADGSEGWYIKFSQLMEFVPPQQDTIQRFFGEPNAMFTDETGSGAVHSFFDYDANVPEGTSARANIEYLREMVSYLQERTGGPVSGESLVSEFLLGEWVSTGDYSIRDGHHRFFSPDYKLRKLHHLSMFHGMGQVYRFEAMPPWTERHENFEYFYNDIELLDDYRACTVLYGNGAYIFYQSVNWPLENMLTEILVVGQLQKEYGLEKVKEIYYRVDGNWVTFEDLYKLSKFDSLMLGQIRAEYENGLVVVVNRLDEEMSVQTPSGEIVLPRYGWVAYKGDSVLAYSALFPGTDKRVDYFENKDAGVKFINPRNQMVDGVDVLTLWINGTKAMEYDPVTKKAVVDGKAVKLNTAN